MKYLILLILLLGLVSFKSYDTEYEDFLKGKSLSFQTYEDNENTHYSFHKIDNRIYQLVINKKPDCKLILIISNYNEKVVLTNKWGEFRFYFKNGALEFVVQEVYKNADRGIDNFTITFDM